MHEQWRTSAMEMKAGLAIKSMYSKIKTKKKEEFSFTNLASNGQYTGSR